VMGMSGVEATVHIRRDVFIVNYLFVQRKVLYYSFLSFPTQDELKKKSVFIVSNSLQKYNHSHSA